MCPSHHVIVSGHFYFSLTSIPCLLRLHLHPHPLVSPGMKLPWRKRQEEQRHAVTEGRREEQRQEERLTPSSLFRVLSLFALFSLCLFLLSLPSGLMIPKRHEKATQYTWHERRLLRLQKRKTGPKNVYDSWEKQERERKEGIPVTESGTKAECSSLSFQEVLFYSQTSRRYLVSLLWSDLLSFSSIFVSSLSSCNSIECVCHFVALFFLFSQKREGRCALIHSYQLFATLLFFSDWNTSQATLFIFQSFHCKRQRIGITKLHKRHGFHGSTAAREKEAASFKSHIEFLESTKKRIISHCPLRFSSISDYHVLQTLQIYYYTSFYLRKNMFTSSTCNFFNDIIIIMYWSFKWIKWFLFPHMSHLWI